MCEKNTIVGNFMTAYLVTCEFGGTTFRNNRMIQPDVSRFTGIFNPRSAIAAMGLPRRPLWLTRMPNLPL